MLSARSGVFFFLPGGRCAAGRFFAVGDRAVLGGKPAQFVGNADGKNFALRNLEQWRYNGKDKMNVVRI
jgi:hypothetical protein